MPGTCFPLPKEPEPFLVPVVRGGPWNWEEKGWELWAHGLCRLTWGDGTKVLREHCGNVQVYIPSYPENPGHWERVQQVNSLRDLEWHAQRGYTGPLPEGCKWAEEEKEPRFKAGDSKKSLTPSRGGV